MKLIAITRVKNELDIIEPFIRHHAALFDQLLVLDDGSADGTYELLEALQREGLPLVLMREASVGYAQRIYMTRLMHIAVGIHGADWVMPLDADEFVETPEGTDLRELLIAREPELLRIHWNNFIWRAEDERSGELNPALRLRWRLPARPELSKVLVPRQLAIVGAELTQGSHALSQGGELRPAADWSAVTLCHFPIRGVAQYAGKVAIGYLQYSSMPHWRRDEGYQYIDPFRRLAGGLEQLAEPMAAQSLRYSVPDGAPADDAPSEAPLRYLGGPLKLTTGRESLLGNVLRCAEAIALQLAENRRAHELISHALQGLTPELRDAAPLARVAALKDARELAAQKNEALALAMEQLKAEHARQLLEFGGQQEKTRARHESELAQGALLRTRLERAIAQLAEEAQRAEAERRAQAEQAGERLAEARAQRAQLEQELKTQLGRAEQICSQLEARLTQAEREQLQLNETLSAQADQLSSRTVKLVQRVHGYVAKTGLRPGAIADRLYRFFDIR